MDLAEFYGTESVRDAYRLLVYRHAIYQSEASLRMKEPRTLGLFLIEEGYKTDDRIDSTIDAWKAVLSAQKTLHLKASFFEELAIDYREFRRKVLNEAKRYRLPKSPDPEGRKSARRLLQGHLAVIRLDHPVVTAAWERNLREAGKVLSRFRIIREDVLEGWLYSDPELIENGLVFTKRQVIAGNGRIDLVGRDQGGRVVLCEVKCEEDRDVLWQATHYPKAYGREHGIPAGEIRMLVVAPSYSDSLREELAGAGAELFCYVQNGGFTISRLQDK